MSRLTLNLPETLQQQLINLAEGEGVSLNEYIVYALTRQVALTHAIRAVPTEEVEHQKQSFQMLLKDLGETSVSEIAAMLDEREAVEPEEDLKPEIIAHLQERIRHSTDG